LWHQIVTIKINNNNYLEYVCVEGSWKVIVGLWLEFVGSEWFKLFDAKKPENLFDLAVSFLEIEIKILW